MLKRSPNRLPGAAPGSWAGDRLAGMEAVFIALMALVVLMTGWVSLLVLYRLFRADNS